MEQTFAVMCGAAISLSQPGQSQKLNKASEKEPLQLKIEPQRFMFLACSCIQRDFPARISSRPIYICSMDLSLQPQDSKNIPRRAVFALELDTICSEIHQRKQQLLERRQNAGSHEPCTYCSVANIHEEKGILSWLMEVLNSKES